MPSSFYTTSGTTNILPTEFIVSPCRHKRIRFVYCIVHDSDDRSIYDLAVHGDWISVGHNLNDFVSVTGNIANHNETYDVQSNLTKFNIWFTTLQDPDTKLSMDGYTFLLKLELQY